MLNSVVLPAPLGPITDTIERSGMSSETPPTAVRPPNSLTTSSARMIAVRRRRARGRALIAAVDAPPELGSASSVCSGATVPVSSQLSSSLREQALRAQDHHEHQQEAEDADAQIGQIEVEAEVCGSVFSTSGIR